MPTLNSERKKKIFYRFYFVVGAIVLCFFISGLVREIINRNQINQQIADYEGKIAKLQQDNFQLSEKITSWKESNDLEIAARTKLGLQKSGEKAIFITRQESNQAEIENMVVTKSNQEVINFGNNKNNKEETANPSKWWRYFFR